MRRSRGARPHAEPRNSQNKLEAGDGRTSEWHSSTLRAYQRRTLPADALIAGSYLAGTNTRRVRRALVALFGGAVGKDTVSRVWRKVKTDWDAWNARSLADEPIVRLILDGTVVRVRLDRKATSISLLVVIGVRADGQKVLLAIKSMGGESTEAWRSVLDDLIRRGLRRPEFLIVDGAPGLEKAIAAVWDGVPVQRCTVHKHRNLLAHAPKLPPPPKWRLRHRAVADSLEEAGARLFTFTCLPPSQWRSARTSLDFHRHLTVSDGERGNRVWLGGNRVWVAEKNSGEVDNPSGGRRWRGEWSKMSNEPREREPLSNEPRKPEPIEQRVRARLEALAKANAAPRCGILEFDVHRSRRPGRGSFPGLPVSTIVQRKRKPQPLAIPDETSGPPAVGYISRDRRVGVGGRGASIN